MVFARYYSCEGKNSHILSMGKWPLGAVASGGLPAAGLVNSTANGATLHLLLPTCTRSLLLSLHPFAPAHTLAPAYTLVSEPPCEKFTTVDLRINTTKCRTRQTSTSCPQNKNVISFDLVVIWILD